MIAQQPTIFGGNTGTSYEQLKRKQALVDQLARGSLATPRNVGEGLTAIGRALAYRRLSKKATEQEAVFTQGLQDSYSDIMGGSFGSGGHDGGQYSPAPAPQQTPEDAMGLSMGQDASQPMSQPDSVTSQGQQYSMGEDVANPKTRDLLAKTLMAEAGGEGEQGMLAAGAVIQNRVKAGGYGNSVDGVIMKPGQFSAWNGVTGYAGGQGGLNMDSMKPSDSAYRVADMLLSGQYQDPTGGATHYYNPSVANPKWGERNGGDWQRIGNHIFGSADAGRGGGSPQRAPQNSNQLAKIAGLLSRPEAEMMPAGQKAVLTAMLKQGLAANQPMTPLQQQEFQLNQIKMDQARNDRKVIKGVDGRNYYQDTGEAVLPNVKAPAAQPTGAFGNLDAQAKAAGLKPGTPAYQEFMLNGGGDPATFRALDQQAKAAGLKPGTSRYEEFMATRGAGLAAGASQTAKNDANISNGGMAAETIAEGAARGKENVTRGADLRGMERNMPGLMVVADQLYDLADKATYTMAGIARDEARKQAGLPPTAGAIARAEYIAIVDNQVLPLLRQTFGAAFTAKEGDTLRATLGDPDKSPAEKKAVLRSFIAQKQRDLVAMGGRLPPPIPTPAPVPQTTHSPAPPTAKADFQKMDLQGLLNVDVMTLDAAGMDAWEKRLEELQK